MASTAAEVWELLGELIASQKETDRKFQETDRRFQETDRKFQETAIQVEKTSKKIEELGQKTKDLEKLFTSQWGRLIESLVEGALVRIFNARNIAVTHTITRAKGNYQGQNYEFDLIVINGKEIIIVEVKTTLRPKYVTHFLNKLDQAKIWMPEYANKHVYGAMAFLQADAGAEAMVIKRGLFAIRATGDSASIINPSECELRVW